MIEFNERELEPGQEAPELSVAVVGVGGAGANVLDRIALEGMTEAELVCMNTDIRALTNSVAATKVQLGKNLTQGLGAGGDPDLGEDAAKSSEEEIRNAVKGKDMVFVCAGLGGGTGSGSAPFISSIARSEGAFVVVFTTMPFSFEGRRRLSQAQHSLSQLRTSSNALIAFDNDRMGSLVLPKQGIQDAFAEADKIISQSVRAVIQLVTKPGLISIGMDDLMTALDNEDSRCLFGYGQATGENRAQEALAKALKSPLLDKGEMLNDARNVLVHVCGGDSMTLFEVELLMKSLEKEVSEKAQILFGVGSDPKMADKLSVTVISSMGKPLPPTAKDDARKDTSSESGDSAAPQDDAASAAPTSAVPFAQPSGQSEVKPEITFESKDSKSAKVTAETSTSAVAAAATAATAASVAAGFSAKAAEPSVAPEEPAAKKVEEEAPPPAKTEDPSPSKAASCFEDDDDDEDDDDTSSLFDDDDDDDDDLDLMGDLGLDDDELDRLVAESAAVGLDDDEDDDADSAATSTPLVEDDALDDDDDDILSDSISDAELDRAVEEELATTESRAPKSGPDQAEDDEEDFISSEPAPLPVAQPAKAALPVARRPVSPEPEVALEDEDDDGFFVEEPEEVLADLDSEATATDSAPVELEALDPIEEEEVIPAEAKELEPEVEADFLEEDDLDDLDDEFGELDEADELEEAEDLDAAEELEDDLADEVLAGDEEETDDLEDDFEDAVDDAFDQDEASEGTTVAPAQPSKADELLKRVGLRRATPPQLPPSGPADSSAIAARQSGGKRPEAAPSKDTKIPFAWSKPSAFGTASKPGVAADPAKPADAAEAAPASPQQGKRAQLPPQRKPPIAARRAQAAPAESDPESSGAQDASGEAASPFTPKGFVNRKPNAAAAPAKKVLPESPTPMKLGQPDVEPVDVEPDPVEDDLLEPTPADVEDVNSPEPEQQTFDSTLEPQQKGRFDKGEPTVENGEDLDLPTFLRRKKR